MRRTSKEFPTTEFKSLWQDEYLKIISAFANTEMLILNKKIK